MVKVCQNKSKKNLNKPCKPMLLEPKKVDVMMAVAHLHNFLWKSINSVNILYTKMHNCKIY